jgi:hypothetical protein
MAVITEMDVKRDERGRVTLPKSAAYAHYHLTQFDNGIIELAPRQLVDATISQNTLAMMDAAMRHMTAGQVGAPINLTEVLDALGADDE